MFERAAEHLLQSEELLPVAESLFFDINHSSHHKNLVNWRFKRTNHTLPCWLFGFPSCGYERSNVHAHVATVRTHQICVSFTDSENVILQEETETIHVPADILADARGYAFDAFEVPPLLY